VSRPGQSQRLNGVMPRSEDQAVSIRGNRLWFGVRRGASGEAQAPCSARCAHDAPCFVPPVLCRLSCCPARNCRPGTVRRAPGSGESLKKKRPENLESVLTPRTGVCTGGGMEKSQ
jgi:hypothetical protein